MKVKIREAIAVTIDGFEYVFYRRNFHGIRGLYYTDAGNRFILKYETNNSDDQCRNEAENWRTMPDEDRHHFAPVLAHGLSPVPWVLMPFIKKGCNGRRNTRAVLSQLRRKYPGLADDLHRHKYIITEDGPIVVDYGLLPLEG